MNELPSATVDQMLAIVTENYGLAQRWFARKAELLGTTRLRLSDMRAPIGTVPGVPYAMAVRAVTETFAGLAPSAGSLVAAMLADGRVDALPRPGKRPGSICWNLGPHQLPRIVMSYFGTSNDVITLAHELGHALHYALSGQRHNGLVLDAPLGTNEIAPAFAELLVQDWLLAHEPDRDQRLAIAARRVDTCIDAIYMSTFVTAFEARAHQARDAGQRLTDDRVQELWRESAGACYGPAVDSPPRWGLHWALVPHVMYERFYAYSYSYARLVALNLHATYQRDPEGVGTKLMSMLASGGTASPAEQLSGLGIDLADAATWRAGMTQFAGLLEPLLADGLALPAGQAGQAASP
jgi:oligoendopeptidase F